MRKTTFKFETTDNNGKVREHVLNERYGLKRPQCTSEWAFLKGMLDGQIDIDHELKVTSITWDNNK
tara:strand:+ start:1968 stop:2165 length:198 start_codon:yes stop_codon:yes gene_type:complete